MSLLVLSAMFAATAVAGLDVPPPLPAASVFDVELQQPATGLHAGAVSWGRPLDGGPLRVLAVVPVFAQGDLVGLSRRLDIEADVAPVWSRDCLGTPAGTAVEGFSENDVAKRITGALEREHDVILVGNVDLAALPEAITQAITECVQGGQGLVVVQHGEGGAPFVDELLAASKGEDARAEVERGTGLETFAEHERSKITVRAGQVGKGRVCAVTYHGPPAQCQSLIGALDAGFPRRSGVDETGYSLIARAATWAAGYSPAIVVRNIAKGGPPAPAEEDIPPTLSPEAVEGMLLSQPRLPSQPVRVEYAGEAERGFALRLGSRLPSRNLQLLHTPEPLPKSGGVFESFLVVGPEKVFVDAWVLRRDKVVDWYTEEIDFAGLPRITGLHFTTERLLPHGAVGVTLHIQPRPGQQDGSTVALRAIDPLGREVARVVQTVNAQEDRAAVSLNLYDLIANQLQIEAFLTDAPRESISSWDLSQSSYARSLLPVRVPRDDRGFALWAEGSPLGESMVYEYHRALAKAGVDRLVLSPNGQPLQHVADAGLAAVVRLDRTSLALGENGLAAPDSEATAAAMARHAGVLGPGILVFDTAAARISDYGALSASAPHLEAFRRFLQQTYPSLDALNDAWGAGFPSWSAVTPPGIEVSGEAGASFAAWLDTNRFRTLYPVDVAARLHAAARSADPEAHAGAAALDDAQFDWANAAARLNALALPGDPAAIERVRSYRRPGTTAVVQLNGPSAALDAEAPGWLPWYAALSGFDGVAIGHPYGNATAETLPSALSPDARPTAALAALGDLVEELREGLGEVYRRAERVPAAIAVYDSPASRLLDELNPVFSSAPEAPARAWVQLLTDLHVGYDFVSPEQAAQGRLDAYSVLILPSARAMSDAECDAVTAFARHGALVIADVLPGQFDAHGVLRSASPLAGLFGVAQQGTPVPSRIEKAEITLDVVSHTGTMTDFVCDSAVAAAGAVPHGTAGEAPLWLRRKTDAAATLLLNHAMPGYTGGRDEDRWFRSVMQALLAEVNVSPVVPEGIDADDGLRILAAHHRLGVADLFTVLRVPGSGRDRDRTVLRLGKGGIVYDVRRGLPVTRPRRIAVRLAQGDAAVYAQLPYRVEALTVETPENGELGRRIPFTVRVRPDRGLAGSHVVHVSIAKVGTLKPIRHYSRNLYCAEGKGEGFIPLALNDEPGYYRLTARDVFSGVSAAADIEIR